MSKSALKYADPTYYMTGGGGVVSSMQGGPMIGDFGGTLEGLGLGGVDMGAADSATQAAAIQAAAQREALEYLKEREAIPQQFREGALTSLGGLYGLEGGEGDQQAMIERAMASPLYQSMIGGREAGEEAIMRSAAATGGLRSGGTQAAMYDYNTQLQNQALLESYNQQLSGLSGLAQLPSMAPQIASGITGIGTTQAAGVTAAAQAQQIAQQQQQANLMGLGQLGISLAGMFSDRRLKKDIKHIGEINGHKWYSFTWNGVAEKLGLSGNTYGCMADEVYEKAPGAVILKDGFMMVLYGTLGILEGGAA